MACECHCTQSDFQKIIRILNILSGLFLIALGILRFVFISYLKRFLGFLLSIYYIIFGMIVISSEFNWEFIKRQFSFQQGIGGRGMFLIFIGILSFDHAGVSSTIEIINLSCGVWTCFVGLLGKKSDVTIAKPVTIEKNAVDARL